MIQALAPVMPGPHDPPQIQKSQVFHNMEHLSQKRTGFKREFGRIRTRRQRRNDTIAEQIMRRERAWMV